jgi:2'-5' RNA ligase
MRCFIAIAVPASLKGKLVEVQGKLKGNLKLVEPENFHINMKFLGEVDDSKIQEIKEAMDRAADVHQRFTVQLYGIGGFPSSAYPRVVWVGVKGDFSVQKTLEEELEKLGFPREPREFRPHLTLARKRSGRVSLPDAGDFGKFEANNLELIKSELSPSGPEYFIIHSAELK